MVAKSSKNSKAKTASSRAAKSQAPAKKKAAPVSKTTSKATKTKSSDKNLSSTKSKKPATKSIAKPAPKTMPKNDAPALGAKVNKKAVKAAKPKPQLQDEATTSIKLDVAPAATLKSKASAAFLDSPSKKLRGKSEETDDRGDGREDGDDDEDSVGRRARSKENGGKKVRAKKRSATEEFLVEDMDENIEEDEDVEPILDDLDPFASTLLLDPDLIEAAPITSSQPIPPARTKRLAPRVQTCADCGGQFGWLSIEKLCFNCLKRRVSQRKKDEDYSGYGTEESGGGEEY